MWCHREMEILLGRVLLIYLPHNEPLQVCGDTCSVCDLTVLLSTLICVLNTPFPSTAQSGNKLHHLEVHRGSDVNFSCT